MWTYTTAIAIFVYSQTQSTSAVAVVSIAQFGPQLLLTPLSGKLSDRHSATSQILVGRLISIVGSTVLVAWILGRIDVASHAELIVEASVSSFLVGMGFVIGGPAMQAIVPRLVAQSELTTATVLNTSPATIARITGPIVGAWLLTSEDPVVTFIVALWITALVGTRPIGSTISALSADSVSARFGCIPVAVVVVVLGLYALRPTRSKP